ncbi:prephenate dehydratase [Desulfurispira natronophila]|uniref:Bifunctional chorismate mutase/prephenate dehydratase n=1 Tax=Desulfurispira natronophila TaxID=682562 RepID=A0A7W8DGU7_9BACT|nr:chorismate mutase/prephenate dehydratase [Desulfurispira natronophila]
MTTGKELDNLRQSIDAIDDQLLALLNQRAELAIQVGKYKSGNPSEFYVPSREKQIYTRLLRENPGPVPDEAVRAIFREVISACLNLEQPLTIAYLGPEATFTHIASMEHFGQSARYQPSPSIRDVFSEVERGRVHYGVAPIENSTEGVVNYTLDCLVDSDLSICAEIELGITHHLMSLSGKIESIRRVYSHPHAIAQCRQWLDLNLPEVELVDITSTARAAEIVSHDETSAAICSELAGKLYSLVPVVRKIEDKTNNFTRFIVVGNTRTKKSGNDKTSVVFSLSHAVGSLYHALEVISRFDINMTKIESRPSKMKAWEYLFHIDIEGHCDDENVSQALDLLGQRSLFLKVLGSYPKSIPSRKGE